MNKNKRSPAQKKPIVKPVPVRTPVIKQPYSRYRTALIAAFVLIITFLAFTPSLQNHLLKTWDDQAYVTHNDLLKSLSFDNLKKIFKDDKGLYANYHPLTIVSLAVNYHFSQLDSFGYHLTNIFLHLLNTLLVFVLIYYLTGKHVEIAVFVSLLFGIHPMHVESVTWISERKDVLYTLFFLSSLLAYQFYVKKNKFVFYFLSLLLFILSLLSKAMAVSLPLVLILIDRLSKRKWSLRMVLEKLPFIIIAVILGIVAIRIQSENGAIGKITFPLVNRILHVSYGFVMYLVKILFPTGLSAFYPYPYPLVNSTWVLDNIPSVFFFTMIMSLLIITYTVINLVRPRKYSGLIVFGLFFYALTLGVVLQYIPVGRAIMADRYAYVPSIGIFLAAGWLIYQLYQKPKLKAIVTVLVLLYSSLLFYQTLKRNTVWRDDDALWTDVITQYPDDSRVQLAVENRANYYYEVNKFNESLNDYKLLSSFNPGDDNVLAKIGKIYGQKLNEIDNAIVYFLKAYEVNPKNLEVLRDLGTAYGIKGDLRKALDYSLKGLQIKEDDAQLLMNAGISYQQLGDPAKGAAYIARAHQIDPSIK